MLPLVVGYLHFFYLESCSSSEQDEVPVPVSRPDQMISYWFPEALYSVSIMDVDSEDRPVKKVVDSRSSNLRTGSTLSPSRNKVRPGHALQESGYVFFRVGLEVRGKNNNHVSS